MKQIDRLVEYFLTKGLKNYTQIENFLGLKRGILSAAGKKGTSFSGTTVKIITEKCPELSMEWLLFGNGEMLNSPENTAKIDHAATIHDLQMDVTLYKKLYEDTKERYGQLLDQYHQLVKELIAIKKQ